MEDYVLVQQLKNGDNEAFRTLVELYQDRVINTCYRFLYHREDAEDTAQEVFVEVYRSVSRFKGDSKFSTWLYRVAVTKSLDHLRKSKRKKRFAPVKSLLGMQEEGQEIPAPEHHAPPEQLEQEERLRIMFHAIDKLPENQRIAFTLSKCQDMSNKEIAAVMGVSLSSVESLIHRAKKKLRESLYHYFERDLKKNKTTRDFIARIFCL